MRVIITRNGEKNLEALYSYHAEYSFDYADKFHDEILDFIVQNLSEFPELGRVMETNASVRKLVFDRAINIYYTVRDDAAYVLFILDGRRMLNDQIGDLDKSSLENLMG